MITSLHVYAVFEKFIMISENLVSFLACVLSLCSVLENGVLIGRFGGIGEKTLTMEFKFDMFLEG